MFLRTRLEDEGLVAGGTSPDGRLVEMVELPDHPFYVASQFHPEFNSRPNRPEPLFREFVGAATKHAGEVPAEGGEIGEPEPETDGMDIGITRSSEHHA
jgi:CTP synthase